MNTSFIQLFTRFAVATAFLSAVADRFGYWGAPGSADVVWGNWENFVAYSNQLNFFAPTWAGIFFAVSATVLEVLLAILLLIGYRIRLAAIGSGVLLVLFALSMTLSLGIKSTFNYSVWVGVSACFLLASIPTYLYSIDHYLAKKRQD
ncbi:hypothetical protein [Sphingobacterium sp. SYP-B4668]|uniref:hypothetical protein n=1 Tax=Sphingobacterium sp. SYP-B4668 TaxID=2996035 RepID=UPI0022DE8A0D|nr:hypothetical protein [Sphingobacterium sp. SYP-B4668]